ncbi:MAG: hypothetical protein VYB44_14595 [Bacteroidota bacterium]|nr:hypothetical protein [Bacteroidota bacterium]
MHAIGLSVTGNTVMYAGSTKTIRTDTTIVLAGQTLMLGLIEGHSHILLHPYNETSWNDQLLKESIAERSARAVNHLKASLMAEKGIGFCPTVAAGDAIMEYSGWKKSVDPEPFRISTKKKSFELALQAGVKIVFGGDVGIFLH